MYCYNFNSNDSKIELNDQFVEYFDESLEFRQSAEFALENLTGIYRAEWSIHLAIQMDY